MRKPTLTNPKKRPKMPSQTWFCAQNDINPNYYLYDYNEEYQTPVWTDDLGIVLWAQQNESSKIVQYITTRNITNVTVVAKGGDSPAHRPPL